MRVPLDALSRRYLAAESRESGIDPETILCWIAQDAVHEAARDAARMRMHLRRARRRPAASLLRLVPAQPETPSAS